VKGFTAKNFHTHVWTIVIGTYKYVRIVRHHGHKHRVTFRGIEVSAQRCKKTGCFGKVREARLWSPHQIGTRPGTSRSGGPQAGAVGNFCLSPAGTNCAAPWDWAINNPTSKGLKAMREEIVQPCAVGGLAGYGLKVSEGAAGMALAEGATMTAAQRAAALLGPEGFAVGTLGGCFFGIGVHGVSSIRKLASALNPFDRSPRWHSTRHSVRSAR
jgi:hypothetical protein